MAATEELIALDNRAASIRARAHVLQKELNQRMAMLKLTFPEERV